MGIDDAISVDLPSFLIEPVVKVLVHVLTIIFFPGLGQLLIVEVIVENLRDLQGGCLFCHFKLLFN